MPKRSSMTNSPQGAGEKDFGVPSNSIEEDMLTAEATMPEKNPHAAALGRLGGQKGGPARARILSAERRSEIARLAAEARWAKMDTDRLADG